MKKKAITIYDIAERLNISPSTVSRGLRDDHRINPETKRLIAEAAAALNYQPNKVAAGLRGGSTNTIGLIVPRINRSFFANAISGIEKVARRRGYQVIIAQSNEQLDIEQENVAALTAARVDGIIASLTIESDTTQHFLALQKRQFPLVFFDRVGTDFPANRVILDDMHSAYLAVKHLIDGGARRIAHFGGPDVCYVYAQRYRGFVHAMTVAGLPIVPDWIHRNCLDEEQGYAVTGELLGLTEPPDAIFSASDFAALGAVEYCRDHTIAVPGDVAVVGFANEPFTKSMFIPLTSVEQHSERMGSAAAELLFRQIDSEDRSLPVEEIVVPGELRVRASTHPVVETLKTP